jgi:hypothetical protein
MSNIYKDITTDEERALFGITNAQIINCRFDGPADGESAMKETEDLEIDGCYFNLRYPIWHSKNTTISNCEMTEKCRAALWYDEKITVENCKLHGPKVLRDCNDVKILNCDIVSDEFAWKCNNLTIENSTIESVYPFFMSSNVHLKNCKIKAKYIFQYSENCVLENCEIETKDAFWECSNAKLVNCKVSSEYVAWHSYGAEFINCNIIGTQPFCYCTGLVLNNCSMENCDLAFERSIVDVDVVGRINSIRGPIKGTIKANEIGEILPSSSGEDELEATVIIK